MLEGRNLLFVEVSSFKHGTFPISVIAYNTLILSYFHIIRCCSISKDTNFSASHNIAKLYLGGDEQTKRHPGSITNLLFFAEMPFGFLFRGKERTCENAKALSGSRL